MNEFRAYCIAIIFVLTAIDLPAQNITGTWEGSLGTDQFIQLNIIQTGNQICGYTYDHIKTNKNSFCKAFFEGYYDKAKKRLIANGQYFLKNSGDHVLMRLQLDHYVEKGKEVLERKPRPMYRSPDLGSIFEGNPFDSFVIYDSSEYIYMKKVSDKPFEFAELMQDCIAGDKKQDSVFKAVPPEINAPAPDIPAENIPVITTPPVPKQDSTLVPNAIDLRKNVEQSHLTVNVKTLNLKVYDNAIMDGDTVSIYYNGKLLLSHQALSEKPIELELNLDTNLTRHEIILFAENLGGIPPNTALVVITAGNKRYELFASASLDENAVLVFVYKPD